jgi:sec-independent protein translocase protein TatA
MSIASLFHIAGPDLLVILLIVLLFFGAKKLPHLARGVGEVIRELTKAKDEFERQVTHSLDAESSEPANQSSRRPLRKILSGANRCLASAAIAPFPLC